MTDPRIRRTKDHVLAAAEKMMITKDAESISYASLARESTVSRQTICAYWPTIDAVVAEVLARRLSQRFEDLSGLTVVDRLTHFLDSLRSGLDEPIESTALLTVLVDASHSVEAEQRLIEFVEGRLMAFRAHVGSISPDNFAQLIGPLFTTALVLRQPITDKLMARQVAFGMSILA